MPPVRFAAQASKRAADPRREGSLSGRQNVPMQQI